MQRSLPLSILVVAAMATVGQVQAQGDCLNTIQFLSVTPPSDGSLSQFTTCVFFEEYTEITGVVAGANYEVGVNNGGYITVREGTFDGPVIGQGSGLVAVTPTISGAIYAHFNASDMCTTATGSCNTATVQWLLDCVFPEATLDFDVDCELFEFYINVDVISTGDANTVDVTYESLFGFIETVPGVGVGVTTVGPFIIGDIVDLYVAHETDPICTLSFIEQQPILDCPISINCGGSAASFSHCYGNNEISYWTYEANGPGTLLLEFLSGTIESSNFDVLTIYDGVDNTGPVLFVHNTFSTLDLSGLSVSTTTGFLHMELTTDGVVNCVDGDLSQWNWTVICLDCILPVVNATVVDDCLNNQFSIELDVLSTGDGASVEALYSVNGGANQSVSGLGVGVSTLGPFVVNDQVALAVVHDTDPACTVSVGTLTDTGTCPNLITCGNPPLVEDYCYEPNDSQSWSYQAIGSGTMRLRFNIGTIESNTFDNLTIYDGADNTAPALFDHTNFAAYNLGPVGSAVNNTFTNYYEVEVYASGADLYMEMSSDGSVNCGGPFPTTSYDAWEWEVVCLDCTIPLATASVVDDCAANGFSIPVDVTSVGDGATVNIVYTVNGGAPDVVTGVGLGITDLGPFVINDVVNVSIEHESNELCNISLGDFTDTGLCPSLITCGEPALVESYCYGPNDSEAWVYQAVGTGTMRLRFNIGTIESNTFDSLRIYDGADATAPLLFNHTNFATYNLGPAGSAINNTFTNYYGIEVYATGPDLYMEMGSDAVVNCGATTTFDAWEWEVVCLDCTIPLATASVVDDCAGNGFSIPVDVTSVGDGSTVNIVYTVNGGDPEVLTGVGVGVTDLGPFVINDVVNILIEHESNELCNISLGNFTDTGTCPTLVECGTEYNEIFCHGNSIDERFYYQGTGTFPLALLVNTGTIETCCDRFYVYDGGDITAPELTPPGGAVGNLAGLFFSSTNVDHKLTVRVTTDGSVSCQSGSNVQLDYTLSCLDCNPPEATFEIVQDCDNFQYYVDIDVTTLGSDPEIEITNTGGLPDSTITEPGVYQMGPIVSGTPIEFTLVNSDNSLCNLYSPELVNPLCPMIVCGATFIEETYCYGPNEDNAWAYEKPGTTGELHLTFNRGTIESITWDNLKIYDGPDANGPILFEHSNTATWNLGPDGSAINNTIANYYAVDVVSTTGNLYMTLTSDGSVQCTSSTTYDEWEWDVYCVGCAAPGISYNLVPNCFDRTFKAEVIVTEPPPAEGLQMENTFTGDMQVANEVGVYEFGPYDQNDPVEFELIILDNPLCSYFSDTLTYASEDCVSLTCGFDNYTYCYQNNEDRWYTFQADAPVPITIGFLGGQMLPGDRIVLYNGYDETAAVLYQGNNGGNFTGFALNSQNVNNALTLRIQSNEDAACSEPGTELAPLNWYVACGAVGIEEQGEGVFTIYPNPTEGLLYIDLGDVEGKIQLRVLDMSGRLVIEKLINANGAPSTVDMQGLMSGQYMVQLTTENWVRTRMVQVSR